MDILEIYDNLMSTAVVRDILAPALFGDPSDLTAQRPLLEQMRWLGSIPLIGFEIGLDAETPSFDMSIGMDAPPLPPSPKAPEFLKKTVFFSRLENYLSLWASKQLPTIWLEWDKRPFISSEDMLPCVFITEKDETLASAEEAFGILGVEYEAAAAREAMKRASPWFYGANVGVMMTRGIKNVRLGLFPRDWKIMTELAKQRLRPLLDVWPSPAPDFDIERFDALLPYAPGVRALSIDVYNPLRIGFDYTLNGNQNPAAQKREGLWADFMRVLVDLSLCKPENAAHILSWLGGVRCFDAACRPWLIIRHISHIKIDFSSGGTRAKAYLAVRALPDSGEV